MNNYAAIEEKIIRDLIQAGWHSKDILTHQKISAKERLAEVDFILLYNLFPIAVIEVKPSKYVLEGGISQVLNYAEMTDIPFSFLTDGNNFIKINNHGKITQIKKLPAPKELLKELGVNLNDKDLLLFPPAEKKDIHIKPSFHQAKAVSKTLEKIKDHKRVAIILPVGSGLSYIALQVTWKTIHSSFYDRVLIICDRISTASQLSKFFTTFDKSTHLIVDQDLDKISANTKIAVTSYQESTFLEQTPKTKQKFDFVILFGSFDSKLIEKISNKFHSSTILIIASTIIKPSDIEGFEIAYQYTIKDIVLEEDIRVPAGYKSITLETIAEIISGSPMRPKNSNNETGNRVWALNGRSLLDDGSINFSEVKEIQISQKRQSFKIQPHDILVARISSSKIRLGYVSSEIIGEFFVTDSLIIIRVNQVLANPKDVFEFFKSSNGQLNLSRYASILGTSIRRISVSYLMKTPVLIPEAHNAEITKKPLSLNVAAQAKEVLEKDILPLLTDLATNEEIEFEKSPNREYIAEKLQAITSLLSPPKLEEKIITDYPMPIAMSYRRFLDSKFNPYEQILRLRDVYEAVSFFTYNVVLADFLHRLDTDIYNIKDSGARKAYAGYSMSKRIDFLDEVFGIALRNKKENKLFIPELLESDIVSKLKRMGEFRNQISHTAAATENKQKKLIDKYKPIVEDMLKGLEFIASYRLVRIPELKFKNGRWIRKMEIYTGVVPQLEEFSVANDNEQIKAESDHLILLDQEEQFLDLFPIYQLLASEETHDEMHLCFLKHRKVDHKKLIGESVQGAFEVILDGYDIFEDLQKKIK